MGSRIFIQVKFYTNQFEKQEMVVPGYVPFGGRMSRRPGIGKKVLVFGVVAAAATSYYQVLNHFMNKKEEKEENRFSTMKIISESNLIEFAKRSSFGFSEYLKNLTIQSLKSMKRSSLKDKKDDDENVADKNYSSANL